MPSKVFNMAKVKTKIKDQIEILKSRNVRFDIMSEKKAIKFLVDKTYYFKISAYRENFDYVKFPNGEIKYKDLDFAYLKELSKIDMYLRYIVLEFSLDIEHFLKKQIVDSVTNDDSDDGYKIVNDFLSNNGKASKNLCSHAKSPYSAELINKYINNMPIWVFAEVSTFGDFLFFYNYYYNLKQTKPPIDNKILNQIKTLRNACAHNNCIINNIDKLLPPSSNINVCVKTWCILVCKDLNKNTIDRMLRKQVIYDFVSLLYVYCELSTDNVRSKKIMRLYSLFNKRIKKHKEYFRKNQRLTNVYKFIFALIKALKKQYCKVTISNFIREILY